MTKRIVLQSIPYKSMRYPSLGDYFMSEDGDTLFIYVAEDDGIEPIPEFEQQLILLHELTEYWLCQKDGVTIEQIDAFDLKPENQGDFEPGDLPDSPYREQHRKAMIIEHMLAMFMGITDYGTIS